MRRVGARSERRRQEVANRLLDEMRQMTTIILLHASTEAVQTAAHSLRAHLNDLVALTRGAAGPVTTNGPADLAEMLRLAVIRFLPALEATGRAPMCDIPDGPLWARISPALLSLVLDRYLEQAARATGANPIEIHARGEGRLITLELCAAFGLAEDAVEHLFPGEVIRRHGGTLSLHTRGEGLACLRIQLPAVCR